MFYKKSLFYLPLILSIIVSTAQEILYQGVDTDIRQPTKHNRLPIMTKTCLEGELLYPILSPDGNTSGWTCDCKPSFVYYPATEKCYSPFTQGPCPQGEILIIPNKSSVPKCNRNPCEFGKVQFEGGCSTLNGEDGCRQYNAVIGRKVFLVVDPTSLQLICSDEEDKFKCANNCCKTSSRYQYGRC